MLGRLVSRPNTSAAGSPMIPIQTFSSVVMAELVRRQPASPARTNFAWQIAVGPAVARTTSIVLVDGVLHIRASDARWLKEIQDLRQQVLLRLQHLLGPDVKSLKIEGGKSI